MSFSEAAARLKQLRGAPEQGEVPGEKRVDYEELYRLRARILGVLIRDARLARGRTVEACAASLGIPAAELVAWEHGEASPSLPQLELLAYDLSVPISHFWSTQTLTGNHSPAPFQQDEYATLRHRVVGALLRQARTKADLSVEALAERSGIPAAQLAAYELGEQAIPLTELTSLASATNVSLNFFLESSNRIGSWLERQEDFRQFVQMPATMRDFVSNPVNVSFVELAMWFSELSVDDLRGLAESILHLSRLDKAEMKRIAESILNNITL
ncbi:MAG: XRE family transcriptional regulator [Anaerolineae bacterium]|nr:XRE family transcriptional regulator [Anaerolineae bacterium]